MFVHVVKRGDTIWSIARRYNVSPQRIISDNAIPNPQNLVLGQALLTLIPKTVHTECKNINPLMETRKKKHKAYTATCTFSFCRSVEVTIH